MSSRTTPVEHATMRAATLGLMIDLVKSQQEAVFPEDERLDANQVMIVSAVLKGHFEGRPKTASDLERCRDIPRQTCLSGK